MPLTLSEIREKLSQSEKTKFSSGNGDTSLYPFWNQSTNATSTVRFLPDGDSNNGFFWVEKLNIRLPFNGIIGGDSNQVTVNVPCVEMWRSEYPNGCPILKQVRKWYADPTLKEQANRYWKKASYIFQGFVRESGLEEESAPENPIRRFNINKQLFNLIKAGLIDPDMENTPVDYDHGVDFRIIKTSKGEYADYGTSTFARRESPLTEKERKAIETYGLNNLSEFQGKKPTSEELKIIEEMFEASVDGLPYDPAKWESYYKPFSYRSTTTTVTSVPATPTTPSASATHAKAISAADVLKAIRERSAASR